MRLMSATRPKRTKGFSFAFFLTAVVVACLIAGSYIAFTRTQASTETEVAVEGRLVQGEEALQDTAIRPETPAVGGGFRVCNDTTSTIGVALGYNTVRGWVSEGWWNLPSESCETLQSGQLDARFYYLYAIDYDRGGEWKGRHYMCTHARIFTIRGFEDCVQRGLETTGFFEVDTAGQSSWTVQLTEDSLQQ